MMKIATWLLLWIGSGTWLGMDGPVARVSGRNEAANTLLCNVFEAAEAIRKHANVTKDIKDKIHTAVYGAQGRTHFPEDGKFRFSSLTHYRRQYPRHTVCEYYNHNLGANQVDGAFAETLFGAFLCVCAPPITNRHGKLCGVYHWDRRRAWSGNFNRGNIDYLLLQDVWDEVIKKCTASTKRQESDLDRVERLYVALEAVRKGVRLYRPNGEFLYVLGDLRDIRGCSGRAGNDICAAYHQRVGRWGIPWEQHLRNLLPELYTRFQKPQAVRTQETVQWTTSVVPEASGTHETNLPPFLPPLPSREVLVDEEGYGVIVQDDDFPNDQPNSTDAGWEGENHTSVSAREPEAEKLQGIEGTPDSEDTVVAHLDAETHEDGSLITQPFWLLTAASLLC
ncbi:Variant surface glycoprotein [Trypanosoma congolense IL3000]|uniref:Variant surface glycoprotein n=1 Tax=Trypanosoma congolense (strain IL3000) TaxID=1068625 RepID=F9WCR3_TRYCI|nr:Variant surface glycoprotein [Trypanosoma congolense IL3000]